MSFSSPAADVIRRRYSCRNYLSQPISAEHRAAFSEYLATDRTGPLGSRCRFELVAAVEGDRAALAGLRTYGTIKNPPGFLLGAVEQGPKALEDFGYLFELAVLRAADLGLGTCWLGGTLSKSSFAKRLALKPGELMPAVASIGYSADGISAEERAHRRAFSAKFRLPAEELFFDADFTSPITPDAAGPYAELLEAVRWAPSASNKQPWRVVRSGADWHFYLQRSKHYGKGSLLFTVLRLADLQRVDLGIAMCHFELVARERGLAGGWTVDEPSLAAQAREYVVTWRPAQAS